MRLSDLDLTGCRSLSVLVISFRRNSEVFDSRLARASEVCPLWSLILYHAELHALCYESRFVLPFRSHLHVPLSLLCAPPQRVKLVEKRLVRIPHPCQRLADPIAL